MTEQKRSIFELDLELDQVAQAFDNLAENPADPAVDLELQTAVQAYFGDLVEQRDRKLDNYAAFIAEQTGLASVRKQEANRIQALANSADNAAKRAKGLLQWLFQSKGWTKQETSFHKFWIQNNGGKRPLELDPMDPGQLPQRFQKVSIEIDQDAVRAALDAGEELCWARYGETGQHLRIK